MKFLQEKYVRWVGIFILAFLIFSVESPGHLGDINPLFHYFVTWCFTAVYWNGAAIIFILFRRLYPAIKDTIKRLVLTYLLMFVWMSVGGIPIKLLFGFMEWVEILTLKTYVEYLGVNMLTAFVVGTIYETIFFFEKWRDAIRQNEELKNQQIRTQFEVLQNQMSPHFLFNSLNTLTTLIAENQDVAIEFTTRLSDVYRYILQTKNREFVPLEEELQFARDYLFLLKMRFPDNLHADFDIPDSFLTHHIAPLTLQMLIENAIKHNVISKTHPLEIRIYIENGESIVVKNNLQKKNTLERGTKTGLSNIRRRYELLGGRQIDVITTAENFMVAVPLIKVQEEKQFVLSSN